MREFRRCRSLAAEAAAEIGRDRLPKGDARDVTVELKNEHRQRILTVTMEIHRVDPEPLPHTRETGRAISHNSLYGMRFEVFRTYSRRLMERRRIYSVKGVQPTSWLVHSY